MTNTSIIEIILVGVDIIRRRWWLALLPLLLAIPIALVIIQSSPRDFTATATVLLQPAADSSSDRGYSSQTRSAMEEQIRLVEVWLKSDRILGELLPRLLDEGEQVDDYANLVRMRQALSFELNGSSLFEIRLRGSKGEGLGRKLEVILARLMEGLLLPDSGILTAKQLIVLNAKDDLAQAKANLDRAIGEIDLHQSDRVKNILAQLHDLSEGSNGAQRGAGLTGDPGIGARKGHEPTNLRQARIVSLRGQIDGEPSRIRQLEQLYGAYASASMRHKNILNNSPPSSQSYLKSFGSPENMIIVGRPADPLKAKNKGLKYAALVLLLGLGLGGFLVLVWEFLYGPVRTKEQFESITDLPVVARFS